MNSQFLPLLRNEVVKAKRRKVPYFGIGLIGLLCVLIYFVGGAISSAATANAWGYVVFSMQLVFTDLGPICIIMFVSMLVAEETAGGTIRAALAAPVHRWELYLAKAVTGLGYMLILSATAMLCSVALPTIHYQFGAVGDSAGVVYGRDGRQTEIRKRSPDASFCCHSICVCIYLLYEATSNGPNRSAPPANRPNPAHGAGQTLRPAPRPQWAIL